MINSLAIGTRLVNRISTTVSFHLCCNPLLDCFLCDSRSLLLAVLCLFWPYMGPWGHPLARHPSQPIATLQQPLSSTDHSASRALVSCPNLSIFANIHNDFCAFWARFQNPRQSIEQATTPKARPDQVLLYFPILPMSSFFQGS